MLRNAALQQNGREFSTIDYDCRANNHDWMNCEHDQQKLNFLVTEMSYTATNLHLGINRE